MPKTPVWPVAVLAAAGLALAPAAHAQSAAPTITATPITKPLSAKGASSTVTIRNVGTTRLTGLTLRAAGMKGVRARFVGARRGVRTLKPLKAGGSVRVRVTLRRAASGPKAGAFGLRLRQKGRPLASGRIAFGPKAAAQALTGRYYWGSTYSVNGTTAHTVLFTGPDFVFVGDAEGAIPTCAAASETCLPYTYDAKGKALTIGGRPATMTGSQLRWDDEDYNLLGVPKPGARWDRVLTYANSSGLCPLSCTYFREDLTFLPDGTFVRGSVTSGTSPGGDFAAVPADRKGTYEIRADRTLRLAFADGKERVETVGIFPEKDGSYLENPNGVVLNGDGYFDIRD
jgi:hypothetical protein